MGIRVGYGVRCPDGAPARVKAVRALVAGEEPCFATIVRADGEREVLLRELVSDPEALPALDGG